MRPTGLCRYCGSLHAKGYISDPANKNKSVWLTDEGAKLSEELFEKLFAVT